MDGLLPLLEQIATEISNDGLQHLSSDLITYIHNFPPEWTAMMRRVAMAYEQVHQVVRGDLPTEDESSEEDDDTKSDDESDSDQQPSGAVPSALVHLGVFCFVMYILLRKHMWLLILYWTCFGHMTD